MIAFVFALMLAPAVTALNGTVTMPTAFGTGHVLDWGACAAVLSKVGRQCFQDMPKTIQVSPELESPGLECVTHVHATPCWSGAMKFEVRSTGYDCDALVLLYGDAAERCMRNKSDARFWAAIGYGMAISLGLALISACFAACFGTRYSSLH